MILPPIMLFLKSQSTPEELEDAISSAHKAFPKWRDTSIIKRQGIAFKFVQLLRKYGSYCFSDRFRTR